MYVRLLLTLCADHAAPAAPGLVAYLLLPLLLAADPSAIHAVVGPVDGAGRRSFASH